MFSHSAVMLEAFRNLFPGFPCRVVVRFHVQAFSYSGYEGLPVGLTVIKKEAVPPLCPIVVKDLLFSVEFFYDFLTGLAGCLDALVVFSAASGR